MPFPRVTVTQRGRALFLSPAAFLIFAPAGAEARWSGRDAGLQLGPRLVLLMPVGGLPAALAANRPVGGGSAACLCPETHVDGEETQAQSY